MVDIKAILAATVPAFVLPPLSLTTHSIYGSHEEIPPITLGVLLAATSEFEGPSRPGQGGERISQSWLESLSDQECLWHFRYGAVCLIYIRPEDIVYIQVYRR